MKLKRRSSTLRPALEFSKLSLACAAVILGSRTVHAANTVYTLPSGSVLGWESAAWTPLGGTSLGVFPNAAGDTAQYNGAAAATTALDLAGGGPITVGSLLNLGAGSWTIGTGTSSGLILNNTGGTGTATIGSTGAGNLTVVPNISFTNGLNVTGLLANTVTLSGAISGSGGLNKTTAGTLIFDGATSNTYTGNTTISGGNGAVQSSTLSLRKTGGAIAVPGNLVLDAVANSGASLSIGSSANTTHNQYGQQFGATSVISFTTGGTGPNHSYFSLYGNDQTVAGISELTSSGGVIQISQSEVFALDATLTINNSADFVYRGYLRDNSSIGTGKLSIVKTGAGKQSLEGGLISYTGSTAINAGILELNAATAFNSTVNFDTGSTGILQIASAAQSIRNLSTTAATTNSAIVQNASGIAAVLTVNQVGDSAFGGVLRDNTGGGSLGLTKIGTGTLTLANTNTYTGTTNLNSGTLSISSNANLGSILAPLTFTGGMLRITGTSMTNFGSRSYNFSAFNGGLDIADPANTFTIADPLGGTGSLIKSGAGTLLLTGANTYTGNTVINEGVLRLGSAGAMTSTVFVQFGATAPAGTKLQLNGFNATVGSPANSGLSSTATTPVIENGSATPVTFTVNAGVSNSYAGLIQDGGAGALNFTRGTGTGTLTLSNANTYTGVTTITGGALSVTQLANGGLASGIGTSSAAASNLILNGGALQYSGSTTASTDRAFNVGLSGGTLDASGSAAVTFANTSAFANNGQSGARTFTLRGNSTAANTFAGRITDLGGATALTKDGVGTWTLTNAANDYTGTTTISGGGRLVVPNTLGATNVNITGGTLAMSGDGVTTGVIGLAGGSTGVTLAGGVTAATRGGLDLVDGSIGKLTIQADAAVNALTLGGASGNSSLLNFEIGASGASDVLSLLGGKLLANAGGAQINITGLSGFTAGTYDLITFGTGQATGLQNFYVGTTAGGGFSYSLVSTGTAERLVVGSIVTSTRTATGAGSWTTAGSWSAGVPNGTGAIATLGSLAASSMVTLDGNTTVGSLTLNSGNAARNYTLSQGTGGSLIFNNNGSAATLTATIASPVISAPVIMVDNTTVAVNATQLTMSGVISGTGRLTKTGTGLLTLSGANNFSGGVTINGGTVAMADDLNLGAVPTSLTPNAVIINGATLRGTALFSTNANRGFQIGTSGATFSALVGNFNILGVIADTAGGPGALTINGAANYVPTGLNTYSGGTTLSGAISVPQSSSTGPAGAPTSGPFGTGVLNLAGGSLRASTGAAVAATIGNAVTLSADTRFVSGGTAVDRDMIFTGPVSITGGTRTLQVDTSPFTGYQGIFLNGVVSSATAGNGLIKTGTGALFLGGANTFTGGLSILAGTVVGQNSATALGAGAVTLGNTTGTDSATLVVGGATALTFTNPITVAAGSTGASLISNTGTLAATLSGAITLNKALGLTSTGIGSLNLSGVITGSAPLTINGSAGNFVQLSGNNTTFTGSVAVNSGTLQMGNANALTANNAVTVGSNGTFELNNNSVTIRSLADGPDGAGIVNSKGTTLRTLTVGDSSSTTFNGYFTADNAANLALTKAGSGTLTLTGLGLYTGMTTIAGDTLLLDLGINNTGVLGAGGGFGQLTLGATLSLKGQAGGGAVSTQGFGNLTLTAGRVSSILINPNGGDSTTLTLGNTWTRGAGATLFVDVSATGAVLTSSPTLTNGLLNYVTVQDAAGIGYGTVVGGNVVRFTGGTPLLAASDNAAGNFTTKLGDADYVGNTLTLAAGTHATNTLSINSDPGEGIIDLATTTLTLAGSNLLMTGANNYTIRNGNLGGSASAMTVQNYGAGTLFVNSTISGGAGSFIKVGSGTVQLGGTNTYTGSTTVNEGKLILASGNAILDTAPVVLVDKAGAVLQVDSSEAVGALSGGGTQGGNLIISTGQTFTTNDTTLNTTYAGIISGGGNFTKNGTNGVAGTNTLTLSGSNTYAGATTINGGALRITNGSALGNTGSTTTTTVANGARLELIGGITVNNEDLTITGTGTDNNGALQSQGGTTNTWNGNIALAATARLGGSGVSTLVVNGVISGAAGSTLATRTADNASKVVLTNPSNTYAGPTNVVVGILQIAGGDNRLPTTTILQMGNSSNSGQAFVDLNGFNQQVSGLTSLQPATGTQMVMDVSSATAATLTVNNTAANIYAGTLSGALALTKGGTSALTLGASTSTVANSYNGATTINSGSLTAGAATAFSSASAFTLANTSGAVLNLATFSQTIGSLAGGGAAGGNVTLGSGTLTTNGNNTNTTFAGVISGTGGLVKQGTGSLTLGGTNTYTGPTTVTTGSLIISGSLAGGSAVTIGDGAVLAGSGTVGNVVINNTSRGGAIDPGIGAATVAANGVVTGNATAGILNTGTFSLTSGAHLSFQLGGTTAGAGYDQIRSTSLTLAGDLQGSLLTGFSAVAGQLYFIAVQSGSALVGSYGAFSNAAEGSVFFIGSQLVRLTYAANWTGLDGTSTFTGGNDVALMAIPEPSTWVTLLGSMGMALGLRRFRRRA